MSLLHLGGVYWLGLQPHIQNELALWDRRARAIVDPRLRAQALSKLRRERLNPEAAGLFAGLAPRGKRRAVLRLIVAFQVLYDYLDGVNEQPDYDGLEAGLRLHRALVDALTPDAAVGDHYSGMPAHDSGYVGALIGACRQALEAMPATAALIPIARAADRCGRAQSHNHAPGAQPLPIVAWAGTQTARHPGYFWWELAAGGISCLNIHAALATAADPRATAEEIRRVDAAYFPSICALSALLDSLADYHEDVVIGNHSFIAHYRDEEQVALRLQAITADACERIASLRAQRRHRIILAGIVAYYISAPAVWEGFPAPAAAALMRDSGQVGKAMCAVLRARRRVHRRAQPLSPVLAAPPQAARAKR